MSDIKLPDDQLNVNLETGSSMPVPLGLLTLHSALVNV